VIEVFRTTPPLVQLFWFFFALPILIKVEMTPYVAAVLTFSIQSAAFFAEVFRGGIVSVERGQWEAGRALGMAPRQVMRRVVLPQAVKRMIPAFLERAIELMKTTTLVAIVSYADLLFQTNEVAQKTFRPLEVFTVTALIYFVVIFAASRLVHGLERRLARAAKGWRADGLALQVELRARCSRTSTCSGRARSARCACSSSASCSASASASWSASAGMRGRVGALPATAFVEFFRNTPVLVQILWFYYALPILLPFQISPLTAAALGISLNSAAFSAEIFRGGIESIDRGQAEAARALGMTAAQAMRRIVLPQALRRMLPALTNRGIEIFKMTTLASAVAYVELLQQGKLLSSLNFNPIETYTVIALVFFLCLFPLVQATYALERRLGRSDA
jgi:polar amino acid transport system permease protein